MRAVILAAGRGSRMKHHTDDRPKGMVQLLGRSLVERMVDSLRLAGVDDIAIITGYRRESFDFLELPTFHNPDWAATNMVLSLTHAQEWLSRGPVIVCYSDIFVAPDHIRALAADTHDFALTYDENWHDLWSARFDDVLSDAESFKIENGKVVDIGRKCQSLSEISGQYMGLFKTTPASWAKGRAVLAGLPAAEQAKLSVTPLLQKMIAAGYPIHGVPVRGQWGEIDQEEDLREYEAMIGRGVYGDWLRAA